MRSLREGAKVSGVKPLGVCAGPPHLSEEPVQAVALMDLRCHSRGEALKDEFKKDDERTESSLPTSKSKQVKCPVNCHCDVSMLVKLTNEKNKVYLWTDHISSI